jgi:uncharacterized protein YndB with AHSA1/START domain
VLTDLSPATDLTFVPRSHQQRPDPLGLRSGWTVRDADPDVVVELGMRWADGDAALLLEGVRRAVCQGRRLTLVQSGAGGISLLRAAAAELPALRVREARRGPWPGRTRASRWVRHPLHPSRPSDAMGFAITGGLGGIGLEIAAGLADLRLPLWLIDRQPVSGLHQTAQNRLATVATRARLHVTRADVSTGLPASPFPITHLVHAAGELDLCPVLSLTTTSLERTATHKATALRRCVQALQPHGLRVVVAFGSVESREPHPLFGGYALANELMRLEAERLRTAHPQLRVVTAEWSLWSEVGMGGPSAGLAATAGFAVVPPRWGVEATHALLAAPNGPHEIALGGPQSSAAFPLRVVPGIAGSSHSQDAVAVARLIALCCPGGQAQPTPAARPIRSAGELLDQRHNKLAVEHRVLVVNETIAAATVTVAADIAQTWRTITTADLALRWWGDFDHDIDQIAQQLTVQTGSTSFYRLWIEALEPPSLVTLSSAFLGVSPMTTVRVKLAQLPGAVEVRVAEELPVADPAALALAADLWGHRLQALRRLVERTEPPDDLDELLCERSLLHPQWRPLHTANIGRWLPMSGPEFPPRHLFIIDSDGARPFPITCWHAEYDERVELRIALSPTGPVTRVELSIRESDGVLRLTVQHTGWSELDVDGEVRQVLRSRFHATWRHAVDIACTLAGQP